ncbi:cytochrome ubiquinol oxidase subunit I [Lactobacillus johnsonii]|uniref:Cytochrome ubiquinol oxidase subunit I n=1 Tax=Lactobacillus johnsonii TaxID=33959 RepID=A0A9X7TJB7_LACJH|nr:cytochrome ubiquinol oxidase subunit I [Lactobacillus johnsonii]QIA88448.1 cytochrome ubiquinol oxidase subunit I [Lactobacillus johnsonii]TGY30427.1 cytochrome ubiquinol oxidase subunit I [Lactobacillus johnsonii]
MLSGVTMLDLARFQFAMTTVFHFFFVPFSIGMGFIVSIMETLYVVKKDEVYKKMAQFWGKIYLLSFAVGVVTGIIQEFQFGMNWSDYSRFMGDIFGAPLAIEALLAFFMESTFIGLWMFTWNKFNPALHCALVWISFIGSMLSAIWILTANAFMQHPVGYVIKNGKAQMASFWALIANEQLWASFPHVVIGAIVTASFVVIGMAAFGLLRKRDVNFHKKSMRIALWVALFVSIAEIGAGDYQTQVEIHEQPMKFAATEGVYETTGDHAPWDIVANLNTKEHKNEGAISIPDVLTILTYHSTSGSIKGMNQINKELHAKYDKKFGKDMSYYVPVKTLFYSFRIMAGFGALFALLAILGLIWTRPKKNTIENKRWFLWILGISTFLPFIANTCGWFITELGRFPWTVYGLFTIADSISASTTTGELWFTNIMYFLIFSTLGGVMIYYCKRQLDMGVAGALERGAY